MGKQIRFFMTHKDEEAFLNYIIDQEDNLVNNVEQKVDKANLLDSNNLSYYIISPISKIKLSKSGFIDTISSDVIQFTRSLRKEFQLTHGRLWVELKYFNDMGEETNKERWLNEKFKSYGMWITQHFKLSKCKDFYIGEGAYELYRTGSLQMRATPKLTVDFE